MSLREVSIKSDYRSDAPTIVKELYLPCLKHTNVYYRAVGYFSSHALIQIATGLNELIARNGKMLLVTSPVLSREDIAAIDAGMKSKAEIFRNVVKRAFSDDVVFEKDKKRLAFLAHMIANGNLVIKLAIPVKDKKLTGGIYHEKIGIFYDDNGDFVAFTGSNNETYNGLCSNFESCNVFCSWDERVADRARQKLIDFQNLWQNITNNVEVIDLTSEISTKLMKYKLDSLPTNDPYFSNIIGQIDLRDNESIPTIPHDLQIREYQKCAVENWGENRCSGLFEMATGTGKTITASVALCKLFSHTKRLFVVVAAPLSHLVTQWKNELERFGIDSIVAKGDYHTWHSNLNKKITSYNLKIIQFACVVTTNKTLASDEMLRLLKLINDNRLFIGDEAHNLGSDNCKNALTQLNFDYKLGLSATPIRHFDEEGTNFISQYFGKTVIEFSLRKALEEGFLTKYYYHVIPVELTKSESIEYEDVSKKLSMLAGSGSRVAKKGTKYEPNEREKLLLIKRARIIGGAKNKVKALEKIVDEVGRIKNAIFFCGDSVMEDPKTDNAEIRQIDLIKKVLNEKFELKISSYTAKDDDAKRKEIIDDFVDGRLDALVAIKCLDEGVDIPKIEQAFILSSTTNPKQFIQRRGRILRKWEGKTASYIYDFMVIPSSSNVDLKYIKSHLAKEFERIEEFCHTAANGSECKSELLEIKKRFGLLDF